MAWNEPGKDGGDPWNTGGNRPPDLEQTLKKVRQMLGRIMGGGTSSGGDSFTPYAIACAGLVTLWALFGVYQLDAQERAVVLRLGAYHSIVGPGMHWNPPLIDQVLKENVTKYRLHTATSHMLTEDENIVQVKISVQYNIDDIRKFRLSVRDPEVGLVEATESALRHVVGSSKMDQVLTDGREKIAVDVQVRLQDYLNLYSSGILVSKVNIENTDPPKDVQAAFDDVSKAREDEERVKNEAQTYSNAIIPEARGHALRIEQESSAYKQQVIARAQGEAARFEKLLTEYQKSPQVTRERLYLDAMQEVMSNSAKVMVDVNSGNTMMYLPLDRLAGKTATGAAPSLITPEQMTGIANDAAQKVRTDNANTRRGVR